MCMAFGCNPQIQFCYIFRSLNLISFYQSIMHWVSCERTSSYNFTWVFSKLGSCFCLGLMMCMCLDVTWIFYYNGNYIWILSFPQIMDWLCMAFGCNPQTKFCHIFRSFCQSIMHWVFCERNSSYNFTWFFFETWQLFLSRSENVHVIRCNMDFLL